MQSQAERLRTEWLRDTRCDQMGCIAMETDNLCAKALQRCDVPKWLTVRYFPHTPLGRAP